MTDTERMYARRFAAVGLGALLLLVVSFANPTDTERYENCAPRDGALITICTQEGAR